MSMPSALPRFTEMQLDRVALLAGESVVARWKTENASDVVVSLPDGMVYEFDAARGPGEFRFVVTTSGAVTATAYGSGAPVTVVREVAVFEPPEFVPVPMPGLTDAPMPLFGRTGLRLVGATGLAPALVARGRSVLDLAPLERATAPPRPGWATPPTGLTSVVPQRAPRRPRWAGHTRWLTPVPRWPVLRRLGTRLFRGVSQ
ncbi:hypothetical protein SAMN04488074_117101 [Lentzea albidocapillata subsp. violacea]|uniref:Uncharacterized protein n=1 Tax=Lentzea albidocapillata subsp. violacea TaxID=128104 RepID=A0A1G9QXM2_9PSEU|nr:hypothetical protein [Lentzea albidocapillata]SDM15776.1 hypothetical protein SAMN04488074_117101 [Lentzea albidocapillata subsp. violacea]